MSDTGNQLSLSLTVLSPDTTTEDQEDFDFSPDPWSTGVNSDGGSGGNNSAQSSRYNNESSPSRSRSLMDMNFNPFNPFTDDILGEVVGYATDKKENNFLMEMKKRVKKANLDWETDYTKTVPLPEKAKTIKFNEDVQIHIPVEKDWFDDEEEDDDDDDDDYYGEDSVLQLMPCPDLLDEDFEIVFEDEAELGNDPEAAINVESSMSGKLESETEKVNGMQSVVEHADVEFVQHELTDMSLINDSPEKAESEKMGKRQENRNAKEFLSSLFDNENFSIEAFESQVMSNQLLSDIREQREKYSIDSDTLRRILQVEFSEFVQPSHTSNNSNSSSVDLGLVSESAQLNGEAKVTLEKKVVVHGVGRKQKTEMGRGNPGQKLPPAKARPKRGLVSVSPAPVFSKSVIVNKSADMIVTGDKINVIRVPHSVSNHANGKIEHRQSQSVKAKSKLTIPTSVGSTGSSLMTTSMKAGKVTVGGDLNRVVVDTKNTLTTIRRKPSSANSWPPKTVPDMLSPNARSSGIDASWVTFPLHKQMRKPASAPCTNSRHSKRRPVSGIASLTQTEEKLLKSLRENPRMRATYAAYKFGGPKLYPVEGGKSNGK